MTLFLHTKTVFELLIICSFHLIFVGSHFLPPVEEPKIITKKIGNEVYSVKLSFSTYSPDIVTTTTATTTTTQKPLSADDDYYYYSDDELEIDKSSTLFCADVEFECQSNHHCVPIESFCDGKNDCADESDELRCASGPDIIFRRSNNSIATEKKIFSNSRNDSYIILTLLVTIILIMLLKKFKTADFIYKLVNK